MKKIIGVLSYKGGVGTSTVSGGIARALAEMEYKVCLVDCKYCGDLDIILGAEDRRLTGPNISTKFITYYAIHTHPISR